MTWLVLRIMETGVLSIKSPMPGGARFEWAALHACALTVTEGVPIFLRSKRLINLYTSVASFFLVPD